MLISSKYTLMQTPRIMFGHISGHPHTQSRWHIKLVITLTFKTRGIKLHLLAGRVSTDFLYSSVREICHFSPLSESLFLISNQMGPNTEGLKATREIKIPLVWYFRLNLYHRNEKIHILSSYSIELIVFLAAFGEADLPQWSVPHSLSYLLSSQGWCLAWNLMAQW